ncbi:MAG: hypothetical protein Q4C70_14005 [Planctomycetia bacterium]|nr:hypothetical protein [Planctomycetia bacterium]
MLHILNWRKLTILFIFFGLLIMCGNVFAQDTQNEASIPMVFGKL